jgi:GNAT superfamily N-acetyltransferase
MARFWAHVEAIMVQLNLTIEEIPLGSPRLKQFVDFPWRLYRGDPHWTPPLRADLLGSRLLGMTGLLTPEHVYHREADVTHFMAWRGNEPVGRVSAAINHRYNDYHGTQIGFFGFFETIEDITVVTALLDRARDWIKARGMKVMRGPGEYSNATYERQGVLIDGFEYPPTVELTHNPPYYDRLLQEYGMQKAKDYYAYIADVQEPPSPRLVRLAERIKRRRNIETRALVMKDLDSEVDLILELYNEAWAENWGFLPILQEEADALKETLRLIIDPGLVRFAFLDGEPVAVLGAFPDAYIGLRPRWRWYGDSDLVRAARLLWVRRRLPRIRLMFFGVRPRYRKLGSDGVLYHEVKEYAMARGYQQYETSMLLEDNELVVRASAFMGGEYYKAWRIYDLPLA